MPNDSTQKPVLDAPTIAERMEQYRQWRGISKTNAGLLLGKAGYQLWQNFITGKRRPRLEQVRRLVAKSAHECGLTDEDFYKGTHDERVILDTEEEAEALAELAVVDDELDRAEALVYIEDSSYPSDIKARLRAMLAKYKAGSWTKRYLDAAAEQLADMRTEIEAHASAVQRHASDEVERRSEPPVDLPMPAPRSEPPPPMLPKAKRRR